MDDDSTRTLEDPQDIPMTVLQTVSSPTPNNRKSEPCKSNAHPRLHRTPLISIDEFPAMANPHENDD